MFRRPRRVLRPSLDCLDERCLLATLAPDPSGLTPAQLGHAYGLDSVAFHANGQTIPGNGAGQTIAIVDPFHDPLLASDLHKFDQAFGLPDPVLNQVNLARKKTNDGWASEESLDVEWAHAIAPAAAIVVVEARSDSTANLIAAVNVARRLPAVSVVSMSWGGSELHNESTFDRTFTTLPGHIGVTFVASSGDSGARAGAEWPAVSPNILSVGGTTLNLDGAGNYSYETPWVSSSSGNSIFEAEPAFQAATQSSGKRSTPDVSFDANPNTGVDVFATTPSHHQSTWQVIGGTSLGSPAWAAIIAIADQGRALAGLGTLDGPTQTLPTLYKLPSSDFHAITGSNGSSRFASGFSFFARAKPSSVQPAAASLTGLGSPNGSALVYGLAFSG